MNFFQTIWNERNRKVLFENKEFSYKKLKKKKKNLCNLLFGVPLRMVWFLCWKEKKGLGCNSFVHFFGTILNEK